jgi:hypothetical protein
MAPHHTGTSGVEGSPGPRSPPQTLRGFASSCRKASPNSPPTPSSSPSKSVLLNHSQSTTDTWYKAARTTKAYATYVNSGKAFLKSWVEEGRLGSAEETEVPEERLEYLGAFDCIGSQTPVALRLFTAYKCDHEGKGFATAEGIRSAFKQYFERCVWKSPLLFFAMLKPKLAPGLMDAKANSGSSTRRRSSGMATQSLTPITSSILSRSRIITNEPERPHRHSQCSPKISR